MAHLMVGFVICALVITEKDFKINHEGKRSEVDLFITVTNTRLSCRQKYQCAKIEPGGGQI